MQLLNIVAGEVDFFSDVEKNCSSEEEEKEKTIEKKSFCKKF